MNQHHTTVTAHAYAPGRYYYRASCTCGAVLHETTHRPSAEKAARKHENKHR